MDATEREFIGLKLSSSENIIGMIVRQPEDKNNVIILQDPFILYQMDDEEDTITVMNQWILHTDNNIVTINTFHIIGMYTPSKMLINAYQKIAVFHKNREKAKTSRKIEDDGAGKITVTTPKEKMN